jgi:hypothetical protein
LSSAHNNQTINQASPSRFPVMCVIAALADEGRRHVENDGDGCASGGGEQMKGAPR